MVRVPPALAHRIRDGQIVSCVELGLSARTGTRLRVLTQREDLLALGEVDEEGMLRVLRGFNYGLTVEGASAILLGN